MWSHLSLKEDKVATDFPAELLRGFKAPYILTHGALCPPESPPHGLTPSNKGLISREFMKTCQLATSSPFIICTVIQSEGRRRRGQQMTRWLGGITDSTDMSLSKFQEKVKDGEACCAAVHGIANGRTRLSEQRQSI